MTSPTDWRSRHDDFAAAVRGLRRALPQRRGGAHWPELSALAHALTLHIHYEETELAPWFAQVAPAEGPGSMAAWLRDHALLLGHLEAVAAPARDAAAHLERTERLARLEALLEHHDAREARYLLPALEEAGVVIELEEAPLEVGALEAAPPPFPLTGKGLEGLAQALSMGARWPGPLPEAERKEARHASGVHQALARREGATDRVDRREALLDAFDALARWRWMSAGRAGRHRGP